MLDVILDDSFGQAHAGGMIATADSALKQKSHGHRAARVSAAVAAVWWGVFYYGIIDLAVVPEQTPGFYDGYLLETGWGLLYTVLVAAPFVALSVRPQSPILFRQLAMVALAVGVTAIIGLAPAQIVPAVFLFAMTWLIAEMAGVRLMPARLWPARSFDRAMASLTAILAIPAMTYMVAMAVDAIRNMPPTDITMGLDHWPMQAALALATMLVSCGVAAGGATDWVGWHVSAWSVAITVTWLGAVSMMYPHHAASLGTAGGIFAMVWGPVFAVVAEVRGRGARHQ